MAKQNSISANTLVKMVDTLRPEQCESFFLLAFDNNNEEQYVIRSIKTDEDTITCYKKAISVLSESLEKYKKKYADI